MIWFFCLSIFILTITVLILAQVLRLTIKRINFLEGRLSVFMGLVGDHVELQGKINQKHAGLMPFQKEDVN